MNARQKGFTLVELIVVIVILGILAATALPRFINVTTDARRSAVQGVAGALTSAVGVTQARYFATGNMAATSVTMADGTNVTVNAGTGVPTGAAAGIGSALANTTGLTITYGAVSTFTPSGGSASCRAEYDGTTGFVSAVTSDCN